MFVMCQEEELSQIDFKSKKDSQKDFTKGGISNQTDFFSNPDKWESYNLY